jgi:hypothetical protein
MKLKKIDESTIDNAYLFDIFECRAHYCEITGEQKKLLM